MYLRQPFSISLLDFINDGKVCILHVFSSKPVGIGRGYERQQLVLLGLVIQDLRFPLPTGQCQLQIKNQSCSISNYSCGVEELSLRFWCDELNLWYRYSLIIYHISIHYIQDHSQFEALYTASNVYLLSNAPVQLADTFIHIHVLASTHKHTLIYCQKLEV